MIIENNYNNKNDDAYDDEYKVAKIPYHYYLSVLFISIIIGVAGLSGNKEFIFQIITYLWIGFLIAIALVLRDKFVTWTLAVLIVIQIFSFSL